LALFCDWLELGDIGLFDTAICNFNCRIKFKHFLAFDGLICHKRILRSASVEFLLWLKLRNVLLSTVSIEGNHDVDFSKIMNQQLFMNNLLVLNINCFCENMLSMLKSCNKKNCQIEDVVFSDSKDINDNMLSEFLTKCPQLRSFSLINCSSVSGMFVKSLSKSCPQLSSLSLDKCSNLVVLGIDSKARLDKLTNVTLTNCKRVDLCKGLASLFSIAPGVNSLDVSFQDNCSSSYQAKDTIIFLTLLPNLKRITFTVDSIMLEILAEHCPLLESIEITGRYTDSQSAMIIILTFLSHATSARLTSITISMNSWVNEGVIDAIASNCPALTSLNITGSPGRGWGTTPIDDPLQGTLSDRAFANLAKQCQSLKHVALDGSYSLCDCHVISLAEQCSSLESLSLKKCSHLTDASLTVVARLCTQLTHLDCRDIPHLTSETLIAFSEVGTQFKSFAWSGGQNHHHVKISSLMRFIECCCAHVTSFECSNYDMYNGKSQSVAEILPVIATHCALLETLNLDFNRLVTIEALEDICIRCWRLESLSIRRCKQDVSELKGLSRRFERVKMVW
jgi:hypothetical protein